MKNCNPTWFCCRSRFQISTVWEAARQICGKNRPVSRILFLTSYHMSKNLHEAMSVGALGLVVKLKASREAFARHQSCLVRDEQFIGTGFSPFDPTKPPQS